MWSRSVTILSLLNGSHVLHSECQYQISYMEGSGNHGIIVTDHLLVGNDVVEVAFGCTASERGMIYSQEADGVMGMGRGAIAFPNQLSKYVPPSHHEAQVSGGWGVLVWPIMSVGLCLAGVLRCCTLHSLCTAGQQPRVVLFWIRAWVCCPPPVPCPVGLPHCCSVGWSVAHPGGEAGREGGRERGRGGRESDRSWNKARYIVRRLPA